MINEVVSCLDQSESPKQMGVAASRDPCTYAKPDDKGIQMVVSLQG